MKRGRIKWLLAGLALLLGLLAWALIKWAGGTGGPPQFVSLSDGTKYRFGGATWGTNEIAPFFAERVVAHLPKALSDVARKKYGQRFGLVPTWQTGAPILLIWMNQIASPPGGVFALTPSLAVLADENGVEAGEPDSYVNGSYPWEAAAFTVVPRRSRMLEVNFYTNGSDSRPVFPKVGSVRFRNPLYGKYPQWNPESLPVTKMAGEVALMLTNCRVGSRWQRKFATSFGLELTQPGDTNEHWKIQRIEVSDATGNSVSSDSAIPANGGECSVPALFWPDEKALRLKVWLKRTAGFPSDELTTVTNLPLPLANATNGVTITNHIGGHTVLVRNYVKTEPKAAGGIQIDTGLVQSPIAISMILKNQSSDVIAEIQRVETDSGTSIRESGERWTSNGYERHYNSFPANTRSLSVTVSVQKMRTLEFFVKPPNAK